MPKDSAMASTMSWTRCPPSSGCEVTKCPWELEPERVSPELHLVLLPLLFLLGSSGLQSPLFPLLPPFQTFAKAVRHCG